MCLLTPSMVVLSPVIVVVGLGIAVVRSNACYACYVPSMRLLYCTKQYEKNVPAHTPVHVSKWGLGHGNSVFQIISL